jgi:predicted dehydrogenase
MKGEGSFVKVDVEKDLTGHQRCIEQWVKSLRGEQAEILTDGTDSRKTVEVAEAAYRAEETKAVVSLPLTPAR